MIKYKGRYITDTEFFSTEPDKFLNLIQIKEFAETSENKFFNGFMNKNARLPRRVLTRLFEILYDNDYTAMAVSVGMVTSINSDIEVIDVFAQHDAYGRLKTPYYTVGGGFKMINLKTGDTMSVKISDNLFDVDMLEVNEKTYRFNIQRHDDRDWWLLEGKHGSEENRVQVIAEKLYSQICDMTTESKPSYGVEYIQGKLGKNPIKIKEEIFQHIAHCM